MMDNQKIFLLTAVLLMFLVLLFILFGDKGWMEYHRLMEDQHALEEKNDRLKQENLILYKEIDRLKNDPEYIEHVARQEYGMVGKDEVVVTIKAGGKSIR